MDVTIPRLTVQILPAFLNDYLSATIHSETTFLQAHHNTLRGACSNNHTWDVSICIGGVSNLHVI